MKHILLSLVFLFSFPAFAKTITPCFELRKRKWRQIKGKKCAQWTKKEVLDNTVRLKKLKYYVKKYEPACELTKKNYKQLDKNWGQSLLIWKEQKKTYTGLNKLQKEQSEIWRKAFLKLKDQKIPPKHWTQSPVLWVSVGVVVTAGAITAGVLIASSLK